MKRAILKILKKYIVLRLGIQINKIKVSYILSTTSVWIKIVRESTKLHYIFLHWYHQWIKSYYRQFCILSSISDYFKRANFCINGNYWYNSWYLGFHSGYIFSGLEAILYLYIILSTLPQCMNGCKCPTNMVENSEGECVDNAFQCPGFEDNLPTDCDDRVTLFEELGLQDFKPSCGNDGFNLIF